MKLQKHLSKKGKRKYHKYVIILPSREVKKAGFRKGTNLEVVAEKGEIKLVKKAEKGRKKEETVKSREKKIKRERNRKETKNYIC